MIYLDNSATTLIKPPEIADAVSYGLANFGNAGRSFYDPAIASTRAIYNAREEVAKLVKLTSPLQVAFTSGATESLNLVMASLITAKDHVITTVLEHNSVLRPLYRIGCELDFIDCDNRGNLLLANLTSLLKPNSKFIVATHGSNLLGSITNVKKLYDFAKTNNLILILDVSQTLGSIKVNADMADILCFTGHKTLFGPMGTGGIIARNDLPLRLVKTGGSGSDSYSRHQLLQMPDIFEAGTANAHGIAGLLKGVEFVNKITTNEIEKKTRQLTEVFLNIIRDIPKITIYGSNEAENRLPIISLNIKGMPADELAFSMWQDYKIATRAGSHCAPLAHKRFDTVESGTVRFSFSYFNTVEEAEIAAQVVRKVAKEA